MKTDSRITMLYGALAMAALLWPSGAEAQEVRLTRADGRVRADGGGWRAPTPADALRVLREDLGVRSPYQVATAVLRQVHEPRPPEELDALADALAEILEGRAPSFLRAPDDRYAKMYEQAHSSLFAAAMRDPEVPGTPHDGSFAALVRVYETLAARALENGGTDPFEETYRADRRLSSPEYRQLSEALRSITFARPDTEGRDYLLALLEAAEPPVPYTHNGHVPSVWCEAGKMLRPPSRVRLHPHGRVEEVLVDPTQAGRMSELPKIVRDPREFLARCNTVGNVTRVGD